ncbi:hypothetical protein AB1Y20_006238 [Prymnesium parvum]|uniref:ZZ-type domain-containing protein n=1 Tax=Prymnesium parvum TaxID=97485 RepID=A0AB34J4M4_PRYPA
MKDEACGWAGEEALMAPQRLSRRSARGASVCASEGAAAAVLLSVDLMSEVLARYASLTRGWGVEFHLAATVCSVWRSAVALAEQHMSEWMSHEWVVPRISKLPDDGAHLLPLSSTGPYDWELVVYPRLSLADRESGEPRAVIGLYLHIPTCLSESEPSDQPPRAWARRAVVELTVHHATSPHLDRRKFFRHLFTPEARDRGYPADDPAGSFGAVEELTTAGFIIGDVARFSARVRVYPGRHVCSAERISHPLLREDGLRPLIARAYGDFSFICDLCTRTLPSSRLHSCSRGCNFDVCDDCVAASADELSTEEGTAQDPERRCLRGVRLI